jgi:hypothetical protein
MVETIFTMLEMMTIFIFANLFITLSFMVLVASIRVMGNMLKG